MRVLISVRSSAEALLAARGGADFIDLKEPGAGALGGLPVATIREIVASLGAASIALPVSATIGDLPMHALAEIDARVDAVAACGVDYVKVGIAREPGAVAVLDALAACGHSVVPVFIADAGLDFELIRHAAALRFPALMVDTANKAAGSLFELTPGDELHGFIGMTRRAGAMAGLAGALRLEHAALLADLAPDFAGFRSAVCAGARSGALDRERLHTLVGALRAAARSAPPTPPGSTVPGARAPAQAAAPRGAFVQRCAPRDSPSSSERICASSER
jgi:(5-formylfuran-3-yl)methyl phosphate synthase